MSQNAIVKKVVHPGVVEVSLMRQMECGLSCSSCEGCPQRPKEEILALASDPQGGPSRGTGWRWSPPPAAPSASPFWSFSSPASFFWGDTSSAASGVWETGFLRNGSRGAGPGLRSGGPDQPDHHPAEDPGIHRAGVSSQRVRRALCLDMSGLSGRN